MKRGFFICDWCGREIAGCLFIDKDCVCYDCKNAYKKGQRISHKCDKPKKRKGKVTFSTGKIDEDTYRDYNVIEFTIDENGEVKSPHGNFFNLLVGAFIGTPSGGFVKIEVEK